MYSRPTAPKPIGGVLDDIFKLFLAAIPQSWVLGLMAAVMATVPAIYMVLVMGAAPENILDTLTSPNYWVLAILCGLIGILLQLAILIRVNLVANNQEGSVAGALIAAARLTPRAILAGILYGLAVLLGLVLIVIPGFFVIIALCLYMVFIVTQNATAVESLAQSRELTRGNWWRTTAIITVIGIVAIVLFAAIAFVAQLAVSLSGADFVTGQVVSQTVSMLLYVVVYPLGSATVLSIYFDLKLRKEGDDLTQRVEALGPA